jgi:hypothetical protein
MDVVTLVSLLIAACGQVESADSPANKVPAAEDEVSEEDRRYARFRALAASHAVFVDTQGQTEARLQKEPIFHWTNPERRAIAGALYLWTHQGRPHATIGVWTYRDTRDSYELQSLSAEPFVARGGQYPDWRPRAAGLQFARLESEAAPADSEARRLVQMRSLARKHFAATLTRNTAGGQQTENLRLLPQPIYRYEELPPGVLDGAMFSFAQGTDPEVFLLLEAREADGDSQWWYAFAPATSGSVAGILDEKTIWDNSDQTSKGTFVMYLYVDQ